MHSRSFCDRSFYDPFSYHLLIVTSFFHAYVYDASSLFLSLLSVQTRVMKMNTFSYGDAYAFCDDDYGYDGAFSYHLGSSTVICDGDYVCAYRVKET